MSLLFPVAKTRRIDLQPTQRVVSADLLATAVTCIADLIGHIDQRVMQQEERITVDVAKQVMRQLAGDVT